MWSGECGDLRSSPRFRVHTGWARIQSRTTLKSVLVCKISQRIGAVRGVRCIDQCVLCTPQGANPACGWLHAVSRPLRRRCDRWASRRALLCGGVESGARELSDGGLDAVVGSHSCCFAQLVLFAKTVLANRAIQRRRQVSAAGIAARQLPQRRPLPYQGVGRCEHGRRCAARKGVETQSVHSSLVDVGKGLEESPVGLARLGMVLQQRRGLMAKRHNSVTVQGDSSLSTWTPRAIAQSRSGCSRSTAPSTPRVLKPPTAAASEDPKLQALSFCSTWVPAQLDTATNRSIPVFSSPRAGVQLLQPPRSRLANTNAVRMAEMRASCSNGAKRRRHQPAQPSCTVLDKLRQSSQSQLHVAPIRPTIAPVRRAITRRRSQEDLRVDRVLDSMKRSASDGALSRRHGSAGSQLVCAGTVNALGARRKKSASGTDQNVRQAEVDVSKLMAEMAAMAQ